MLSSKVKFSADRQTDRQMDRGTPVKQYAPDLSMLGHKKEKILDTSAFLFPEYIWAPFSQSKAHIFYHVRGKPWESGFSIPPNCLGIHLSFFLCQLNIFWRTVNYLRTFFCRYTQHPVDIKIKMV